MDNNILFRLAVRCEAAGRPNNEDNYQVDEDLTDNTWGFTADKELFLTKKGALLVVCDGMGGMNAGEVASAIAVSSIKEWFASAQLTDKVLANTASREQYIVAAIKAADAAIKETGRNEPEKAGMGSTIVLAWMIDGKVHVGWCGDSRAYCFNPHNGLQRLSHDHSYVQELVDGGRLTEELAFDHPNNNIITRSLGDPHGSARPDVCTYDLHNEDIILLCSDGLCGTLRDSEIQEILEQNHTSMQQCRDALWTADEAAGWHDNVTVALAQILSGALPPAQTSQTTETRHEEAGGRRPVSASAVHLRRSNKLLIILVAILTILLCGVVGYVFKDKLLPSTKLPEAPQKITLKVEPEELQFSGDGGQETLKLTVGDSAIIDTTAICYCPNWVTVQHYSKDSLGILCRKNSDAALREDSVCMNVYVTAGTDTMQHISIPIKQDGIKAKAISIPATGQQVSVKPEKVDFDGEQGKQTIRVNHCESIVSYKIGDDCNWYRIISQEQKQLTIYCEANRKGVVTDSVRTDNLSIVVRIKAGQDTTLIIPIRQCGYTEEQVEQMVVTEATDTNSPVEL